MAGLIANVLYDPATAVTKSVTAGLAMTAFDTTNLRLTFTVPASGKVRVRINCVTHGSTTNPTIFLGVLQSTTIIARCAPLGAMKSTNVATAHIVNDADFVITGLTPGASLTWDAAYGVEVVGGAGHGIKYGGPDDATADTAFGAISFAIWDAADCLAVKNYDPATAVTKTIAAALALTAIDTTNLRNTFTVPASGRVAVRMVAVLHGATNVSTILLGVLEGSTVRGRVAPAGGIKVPTGGVTTFPMVMEAWFLVTGLTGGASLSWDAAYGVETFVTNSNLKYGGPDDTTVNNAWGAFQFEVWDVD